MCILIHQVACSGCPSGYVALLKPPTTNLLYVHLARAVASAPCSYASQVLRNLRLHKVLVLEIACNEAGWSHASA